MTKACWIFIDAASTFGGHEVMLLRWLTELRKQEQITPVLIARLHTQLYDSVPEGIRACSLSLDAKVKTGLLPQPLLKIIARLKDIRCLTAHVLRLKPEIAIVAEGCLLSQAWVTFLLRLLAIKTVIYVPLTQRSAEMGFGRGAVRDWLMRTIYRHLPHAWLTLTSDQAKMFAAWSGITRPVFVLPNTVAAEIETAVMPKKPVHSPLRVLILGRLDAHQKGLDTLLSFLSNHIELSKDFHFTLVGDGPFRTTIEHQLTVNPGLSQFITLRAWSETLDTMREHDVLFLASRYEGVPLVMLEAMALSVPVIATDLPGTRGLLSADSLFSVGDYERAMQLLRTTRDFKTRTEMIVRNHEVFAARASGNAFAQAVEALTLDLIKLNQSFQNTRRQRDDVTVIGT